MIAIEKLKNYLENEKAKEFCDYEEIHFNDVCPNCFNCKYDESLLIDNDRLKTIQEIIDIIDGVKNI